MGLETKGGNLMLHLLNTHDGIELDDETLEFINNNISNSYQGVKSIWLDELREKFGVDNNGGLMTHPGIPMAFKLILTEKINEESVDFALSQ